MEQKTNFFERFWYIFLILAIVLIGAVVSLWILNRQAIQLSQTQAPPVQEEVAPTPPSTEITEVDEQTVVLESQGVSDNPADIEADLKATNLEDIDKELTDIEQEISTP